MKNVNDEYFDGVYQEIWRTQIPDQLTINESKFLIEYFSLTPKSKVLDLMCGYGRHSLALARENIFVLAIDNLKNYISEIDNIVRSENLPIVTQQTGVLNYSSDLAFDLVISMGNCMSFFNKTDTILLLKKVSDSLKKGAHFIINSWMIAEIAYKFFEEESENTMADTTFYASSQFFWNPNRIETVTKVTRHNLEVETKLAVDYIYSISETGDMLAEAGLKLLKVFSVPGKKLFIPGDPRCYMIIQKT